MSTLSTAYELDADYALLPEPYPEEKPALTVVPAKENLVGAEIHITPIHTYVVVMVHSTCRAQPLLTDLETAGFRLDPYRTSTQDQVKVLYYTRAGSERLSSWAQSDSRRFLSQARAILRQHGIHHCRPRRLRPADLL